MTKSNSRLWQAIANDDIVALESSIAQGENVNARNSSGLTPLMAAAGRGHIGIAKCLLDAGADLFAVSSNAGATALHKACQGGSLEVVRELVEAGAFIDAVAATTGHTPIIEATWFKWPDVVRYLLDQGAGLNGHTHYGFSLHDHLQYGLQANARGCDRLLLCKELVDSRQKQDQTMVEDQVFFAAVVAGDLARVRELLQSGAEVDQRSPILNGFNDGHTPLLLACRDGHAEIVVELLRAGADVNAVEPTFLAVPLHKAVYNGHVEITRILAQQPGVDLNFQGATNGYTPLHDALWHGHEACVTILLDAGAQLDMVAHDGLTPLDLAEETFGQDHEIVARIRAATDSLQMHAGVGSD